MHMSRRRHHESGRDESSEFLMPWRRNFSYAYDRNTRFGRPEAAPKPFSWNRSISGSNAASRYRIGQINARLADVPDRSGPEVGFSLEVGLGEACSPAMPAES